jgi:AraC-like DNA-binding protein
MKPALEHLPKERDESFVVKFFDYNYYPTPWHYHPEYEIVFVTESTGKRFIGDHISDFKPGNLAFLGPNIPHTYRNDDKYYEEGSALRAKSIVIHFTEASLGNDFLELPESRLLHKLFKRALYGLDISGEAYHKISNKMYDIVSLSGMKRWLCLIDMLTDMAESKGMSSITQATHIGYNDKESKRLCNVFDWITTNFEKEIRLSEAAQIAQMNENAFSRFFSLRTRKTFSGFIQELRLQKAAKLLVENDMSITQVCYECGYNNVSNFNRQFLNHYLMNPMKYRKTFLKKV